MFSVKLYKSSFQIVGIRNNQYVNSFSHLIKILTPAKYTDDQGELKPCTIVSEFHSSENPLVGHRLHMSVETNGERMRDIHMSARLATFKEDIARSLDNVKLFDDYEILNVYYDILLILTFSDIPKLIYHSKILHRVCSSKATKLLDEKSISHSELKRTLEEYVKGNELLNNSWNTYESIILKHTDKDDAIHPSLRLSAYIESDILHELQFNSMADVIMASIASEMADKAESENATSDNDTTKE